jgi:probable rRNA maturation factor
VSVVGLSESRKLNARFRGRDKPTNVLSFPAAELPRMAGGEEPRPLGDLVICPQVLRAEARVQKKSLRAHWAHLVVHGSLHLIGYDHEQEADANRMERREIAVLRRLGFANPYRSP